ncbi:hypothetical protein H650_15320 [Enterobacter sp. R4-368]|nr:hypothetical protein H650_15320 [Enterobacter sp. R4-368]
MQKAEIARHTAGTGINSLSIPAIIMGTEQKMVTNMVSRTLKNRVATARNLDIVILFRKLAAKSTLKQAQGADLNRKRLSGMLKPCW